MNAAVGPVYSPLVLLKGPCSTELRGIQRSLEAYLDGHAADRAGSLAAVAAASEQLGGVLAMLGFPVAAVFLREMAATARHLLGAAPPSPTLHQDALLQAALQASRYFDWLQRSGERPPFDLLPLINQLRAARGTPPLSSEQIPSLDGVADVRLLAAKRRPALQRAQLALLRDRERRGPLKHLIQVYGELKEAAPNVHLYDFWWLAEAFVLALQGGLDLEDRQINALLRDLDRQIKLLADSEAITHQPDADRTAIGQRLTQLLAGMEHFERRLGYAPPAVAPRLGEPFEPLLELDTLTTVAGLLADLAQDVCGDIDRFHRGDERQPEILEPLLEPLHQLANTLRLLHIDLAADIVARQEVTVRAWMQRGDAVEDDDLFAMAGELALVVDILDGLGEWALSGELAATPGASQIDRAIARLEDLQHRRAKLATAHRAVAELVVLRERFGTTEALDQPAHWRSLAQTLQLVRGALVMLESVAEAVELTRRLEHWATQLAWETRILDGEAFLTAFAEVMVALEYHLELLGAHRGWDADVLEHAYQQLERLGGLIDSDWSQGKLPTAPGGNEAQAAELAPLVQPGGELETTRTAEAMTEQQGSPTPFTTDNSGMTPPPAAPVGPGAADAESVASPSSPLPADDIDIDLRETFFEEAAGELASIEDQLVQWRSSLEDREAAVNIRRSFHTLKGSGRMVGANGIGEFAWSLEQLLNRILGDQVAASPAQVEVVEAARRALEPIVADQRSPNGAEGRALVALMARADALRLGTSQETAEAEAPGADAEVAAAVIPEEPLAAAAAIPPGLEIPEEATPEALGGELAQEPPEGLESVPPLPAISPPRAPAVEEATSAAGRPGGILDDGISDELIQVFVDEADEILNASDVTLQRWSSEPQNTELLNDLRREMHTLKGSSRMAGFTVIGDLSHAAESLLEGISKGDIPHDDHWVSLLQTALDALNDMVLRVRQGVEPGVADDLVNELREQLAAHGHEAGASAQATAAMDMTEYDADLLESFLYESSEILDASDEALRRWDSEEGAEFINDLRREMHTLKGSARMTGIMTVGDLAHALESVLEAIVKGELKAADAPKTLIQRTLDKLNDMLSQVKAGSNPSSAGELIQALNALTGEVASSQAAPVVVVTTAKVEPAASKALKKVAESETIRVSAELLNALINQMGESSIYRARVDQGVGNLRFNLGELEQTVSRLRQQLRRLEIETEAQITFRYEETSAAHEHDEFDPLELDRFSELQQLSRSLMEIVDDLTNVQNGLEDQAQEMSFLLDQQAKVNKEIQQGLMRTRMVSFESVVPRLRRVVRQVAQELGKRAELIISGSESEIDRAILENMVAPLEHMLRNAVFHGIESGDDRRVVNKPEVGTIGLDIRREGAELVLVLSDDGAGLNFAAIRAKAEERGWLSADQSATEQELIGFLLQPGFSTAQQVTQISGRGVGMDVLNATIKSMRGALLIQSESGKGTTFVVRLPYSLAVTQALLVRVGEDTYAVPLLSIDAITRIEEDHLHRYMAGQQVELEYGSARYPVYNLGLMFGYQEAISSYGDADRRPPALLFRSAEARAALQVEAVQGCQEIIVKPVSPQLHSVPGISGATVLGDGRVVVVLELAALVRSLSSGDQKVLVTEAVRHAKRRRAAYDEQLTAMVIDDSITMRKVLARFLERMNIRVIVAKDGVEAVALLEEQVPDIAFLDIEMPRMDGFEVMTHIRNQPHLKQLPVIMVTSRSGEKHRERGRRLGVNEYLIKPYQEDEMVQSIRRALGERELELRA
ncbi:MAG: Hpt domain-containing protein, partial [Candidatus Competibacterales bacterium]